MNYQLVKQVRENNPLRKSFIDLAVKTFDLSFEEWYQQGYWTDAYIPYAFVERNKVIANASANIIDLRWQGEPRRYIQIGTVMTEPDHRNKGLAASLSITSCRTGSRRRTPSFIRQSHHGGFLPQIWLHPQRRVSIYYAGLPASR